MLAASARTTCMCVCRRATQQSHPRRCVRGRCQWLARLCRLMPAALHCCRLRPERLVLLASPWYCSVLIAQSLPAGRQPLPHSSLPRTTSLISAVWLVHRRPHLRVPIISKKSLDDASLRWTVYFFVIVIWQQKLYYTI